MKEPTTLLEAMRIAERYDFLSWSLSHSGAGKLSVGQQIQQLQQPRLRPTPMEIGSAQMQDNHRATANRAHLPQLQRAATQCRQAQPAATGALRAQHAAAPPAGKRGGRPPLSEGDGRRGPDTTQQLPVKPRQDTPPEPIPRTKEMRRPGEMLAGPPRMFRELVEQLTRYNRP